MSSLKGSPACVGADKATDAGDIGSLSYRQGSDQSPDSEKEDAQVKFVEPAADDISITTRPPSYSSERPTSATAASDGLSRTRQRHKKLFIITAALIVGPVVVALALGLAVGLSLRHSNISADSSSARTVTAAPSASNAGSGRIGTDSSPASISDAASQPSASTVQRTGFPVGDYSFNTVLGASSKACTTDEGAWDCGPSPADDDYSARYPRGSLGFRWVITASGEQLYLKNVQEQMYASFLDWDTTPLVPDPSENGVWRFNVEARYSIYSYTVDAGRTALCYHNFTTLAGVLYDNTSDPFDERGGVWRGTAYVTIESDGGPMTPDCYPVDTSSTINGSRIGIPKSSADMNCPCVYASDNSTYYGNC